MERTKRFLLSFLALMLCTMMYAQTEITGTVVDDFGEGVVISVNGNFGDIAFEYPYLTRTLSLNFPKLHKKENKDE